VIDLTAKLRAWRDTIVGIPRLETRLSRLERSLETQNLILGRLAASDRLSNGACAINDWEFKVYSQWGEDGIIQGLVSRVATSRPIFIEFGVEDYQESNTRFLLVNNNWSGFIFDSDAENISRIRKSELYWRYNITAQHAFITRENINDILQAAGVSGPIGLLSIDIDGNDYWIWESLNRVDPDIIIVEYNHRFGPTASVTVPYKPDFDRRAEHFSMIYFGASLSALCKLGEVKGYAFVGCNSAGNDAFFVKRNKLPSDLRALQAQEGFVSGNFRDARDENGRMAFLGSEEEQSILRQLPVVKV
jgi:hypothetical protein